MKLFFFHSKDPEGSEVAETTKKNFTGLMSFPGFKIPSNPKYFKWFVGTVVSLKSSEGNWVIEQSDGAISMWLKDADVPWLIWTCQWMSFLPNGGWHLLGLFHTEMGVLMQQPPALSTMLDHSFNLVGTFHSKVQGLDTGRLTILLKCWAWIQKRKKRANGRCLLAVFNIT